MSAGVIKWSVVGEVMVVHTTEGRIADEQWNAFVRDIQTKPVHKMLGASTGSTDVTSTQRKLVSEVLASKKVSSVVVTDDRLVRGLATAASWFGVNIKSFSWAEVDKCIKELGVPADQGSLIVTTLTRLKNASLAELGR